MASVNKVILIGNLGRDPEVRYLPSGDAVANFSMATTEKWKDKSGEMQEQTEWHRISFFGRQAEICGEYLKKGSSVYVEGRLQTRKWTDQTGNDRYTTEIVLQRFRGELVLLDARGEGGSGGGFGGGSSYNQDENVSGGQRQQSRPQPAAFDTDLDDDVPF